MTTKSSPYQQLLRVTDLHDQFLNNSAELDTHTKQTLLGISKLVGAFLLRDGKANAYQIRTLEAELFRYWNNDVSVLSENFWNVLKEDNISIDRQDPLLFALTKGRFRVVEHAIGARNSWEQLKTLKSLSARFSEADIENIEQVIKLDEEKRSTLLINCLKRSKIPKSQYLKFGECMAYLTNCTLLSKYFSSAQVAELHALWKSF